eukprot:CAMPEP_0170400786 /NCGR_PEP_ID=MMETSP0117_2-20130122/24677_1 /TAXON_ID=400756 /ORGANISM="Durinskia baltica, Strain CSIRO CS-38" /LENGTH=1002 /DNA_ID=CAMNT_0010657545 /DNA_START=260 /DNA_END=3268 /DNA_ORIENTATION=+
MEQFSKPLSFMLRTCLMGRVREVKPGQHARMFSLALLIKQFPNEILFQSSTDESESNSSNSSVFHLETEAHRCILDARILSACFKKVLLRLKGPTSKFVEASSNLSFAIRAFSKSFEEWRRADARRMAANLEETFMQTYSVYIGAMSSPDNTAGGDSGPSRSELVVATQHQLEKIRTAMTQVLGKQAATNRIEEICAAVEAAYYSAASQATPQDGVSSPTPDSSPRASSPIPALAATMKPSTTSQPGNWPSPGSGGDTTSSSSPVESSLSAAQTRMLEKLAMLAGMGQERLAYEIVLNPFYRLPPLSNPLMEASVFQRQRSAGNNLSSMGDTDRSGGGGGGESSPRAQQTLSNALSLQNTASVVQTLKAQMLRLMGDKLVNSLRRPQITSLAQVSVGQSVEVFYMPNGHTPEVRVAGTGSTSFAYTSTPILTARVLAVHMQSAGDEKSNSGLVGADQIGSIDVEYVCDGVREDGVAAARIVLADSAVPDPTPLIMALQDLSQQVASFTPNRPDIQQEVLSTVDVPLLSQMIVNRALDPATDLLPILQFFQRSLLALQAPSRTAITEAWMRSLAESFYFIDCSSNSNDTPASSGQRRGKNIDEVAPLLPLFFERATAVVEEIQRDMANYYISVLVPVLQQHGPDYLKNMFQRRLQKGLVSLDATASLVFSQMIPEESFKATVKDLVEAGVCSEAGFSLEDILPSSLSHDNGSSSAPSHSPQQAPVADAEKTQRVATPSEKITLVDGIIARSVLALLQLPVRLDSPEATGVVPETLAWDSSRLAAMRDLVDRIALECSLVIACKQVMARYQLPAWCSDPNSEVELQHRLDVLLTESDTSMASITAEVSRYVQEALHKFRQAHLSATSGSTAAYMLGGSNSPRTLAAIPHTHPALVGGDPEEVHERVSKGLKDVVAHGNPVLTLFSKRVYKVLLRAMLGQGFKHLLTSYSLQSPAQQRNLSQLVQSVCRLFAHTMRVHKDVYTVVIGRAVVSSRTGTGAVADATA